MIQHIEFNIFKTNWTYLTFGIYAKLKPKTVVLDSASCTVSRRPFKLHQNKQKLSSSFVIKKP